MKWWLWLFLSFISVVSFADTSSSVSYAPSSAATAWSPPAGDVSVYFLGTIFGQIDNILYGSGSQIIGKMFAIFNAAVLALGGIMIGYVVLVSTMNTAHEGEMLGKKFSSIWVPLRTTIGLGLLIPKASGYCLMQIIVMWIVVQGIGVADKVWDAALDYLNAGGVIIHATTSSINDSTGSMAIQTGAANILAAQVCMIGIQTQLENVQTSYLNSKNNSNSGPCAGTPNATMSSFCTTSVPNFLNSVDVYSAQVTSSSSGSVYMIPMPNFDQSTYPYYAPLNGMCGTLKWNAMNSTSSYSSLTADLTSTEATAFNSTRSIAVGGMYADLALAAQTMVRNDPLLTPTSTAGDTSSTNATLNATEQFGIPYTQENTTCGPTSLQAVSQTATCGTTTSSSCTNWQGIGGTNSVLFVGNEFQGAISAYNAVMAPVINLANQAQAGVDTQSTRAFISQSKTTGWLLAGSYFFNLVQLNGSATSATTMDASSGLGSTSFSTGNMTSSFSAGSPGAAATCIQPYPNLCTFFQGQVSYVNNVVALINGSNLGQPLSMPQFSATTTINEISSDAASTVYGFINNSVMIVLPASVGICSPTITLSMPSFNFQNAYQFNMGLGIGRGPCILGTCFGSLVNGLFSSIMTPIVNTFLTFVEVFANSFMVIFVVTPLTLFAQVFVQGVTTLGTPGINPIIGLSMMGINYINTAMSIWIAVGMSAVAGSLFPSLYALFMIFMPLFFTWLGTMLAIAFTTVYYVPFLPYMLFTFGSIGWFMVVIEAMVAAPIVALGILHPEGHDAVGQSSQGFMILLNIFLRPVLMVFGYIFGISLSYVGVWVINAGFMNVLTYMEGTGQGAWNSATNGNMTGINWTQVFGYFFASLLYTGMYLAVVQNAFTLIAELPDKVLRWVGGGQESTGKESMSMKDEAKGKIEKAGEQTTESAGSVAKGSASGMQSMMGPLGGSGGDGGGKGGPKAEK